MCRTFYWILLGSAGIYWALLKAEIFSFILYVVVAVVMVAVVGRGRFSKCFTGRFRQQPYLPILGVDYKTQ